MLIKIRKSAFYFCTALFSVEKVQSNLKMIDDSAFFGCIELTSFEFDSNSKIEKKIRNYSFKSTSITHSALSSVVFQNSPNSMLESFGVAFLIA